MIDDAELDWEDIRAFLTTAHRGSLTAAAQRLRLSPPTLGRRLKRLEDALGGPLFDRLPNRLELTALGRSVLDSAAVMGEAAAAFARNADRLATTSQPVRVTATTSVSAFLTLHLPDLLAETGADLTILSTRNALNLAQREADIALRMDRVPAEGDLVTRRLGRFGFTLYAVQGLRDDWSGHWDGVPVVGLPETRRRPSQSGWVDDTVRERGGRIVARLSELPMRLDAARRGMGMTLLPCVLGDAEPILVRVIDPPAALSEDVHLLVHRDRRDAPAVAAVVDALVRLFRRHAETLAGD
ncbi:DNA-binding transcriptional LysR family regulator [Azospirillum lipoferum]|uniref:LysR family transcriptional regulator n=1 Tax=Azospirillum lipoferum TaxID=193 RepID=A0A5A9GXA6_AZOLI|nr:MULTISPECIES: LysR family transcriptional regulator [Azospirillum]KAA0598432.1 LysR family transcriptional regulator [Azospirillum lipoferum]MCP1609573.1 DNA-binding transcriptional LysR family regulator [Azospirillum lipoferum]MDW5535118.1 LysR family transcriptional regulator [Azospirillum sp. NL1]